MSAIGWFATIDEANSYFEDERLITTAWDALAGSGDTQKTKCLTQAYNRIFYSNLFDVPAYAAATADEDRRKGIQAQGVTEAGIVKEKYADGSLSDIPIPPIVSGILEDFSTDGDEFYAQGVDRDEDDEDMAL